MLLPRRRVHINLCQRNNMRSCFSCTANYHNKFLRATMFLFFSTRFRKPWMVRRDRSRFCVEDTRVRFWIKIYSSLFMLVIGVRVRCYYRIRDRGEQVESIAGSNKIQKAATVWSRPRLYWLGGQMRAQYMSAETLMRIIFKLRCCYSTCEI